jgi:c(7)-type cytochrome triheme protein
MPHKTGLARLSALAIFLLLIAVSARAYGEDYFWKFPPQLPPEEYGNILINRTSEQNGVKPVGFSHWSHRVWYTCRVCHFELEFNMKANTTEITEADNKSGRYCGACHNNAIAFGHNSDAHCPKCHNGDRGYGKEKFKSLSKKLPAARFGNRISWVAAVKRGRIDPENHLSLKPSAGITFSETLALEAEWARIPPAIFPHKAHTVWLDCNNCHPDIFNIKKKTTKHFSMALNLDGEFCGVCHLNVAFPMNDCKRCHPEIKE